MISDRKIPKTYTVNSTFADYYALVVLSVTDCYSFGMEMPGRTWSVDPLAEKYSFQSPYAYATNNPVLFRDILGMGVEDIILRGENGVEFNWAPGLSYTGEDKFIQQVSMALNKMTEDSETASFSFALKDGSRFDGNAILDYAKGGKKSSKDIVVKAAKYKPNGAGDDEHVKGTVFWNPAIGIHDEQNEAFPSMGLLLHEMGHAALFHEYGGADWQDRQHIFGDEEQMIIDHLEKPAMQSLGFGFRESHNIFGSRSELLENSKGQIVTNRPVEGAYYIPSLTPTSLKK